MKVRHIGKKVVLFAAMTMCIMVAVFLGNTRQTEAASGYVIRINRQQNVVTVYKNNVPIKAFLCSTGVNNATPRGTFYTKGKIRWHVLDGPVYGQYCTRIQGHYLFHSVYYYTPGDNTDLATSQYKKLGRQASHGCVRIDVESAKWIYQNCPLGTKVVIYDDAKNPGPLGKPKSVKLTGTYKGKWDPTDPDPDNPYYKNRPTINTGKVKTTVIQGSSFDLKDNVTVKDYKGRKVAKSRLSVVGKVDTTKPGKYLLTYRAQDKKGHYASKEVWITVKKASKPVIMGLKSSVSLKLSNKYITTKHLKGVTAFDRNGSNLTKKIKVSFSSKYTKNGMVEKLSSNRLRFYKPGTYSIKYTVTGSKANGKKKTTKTVKYQILDNTRPVIKNTLPTESVNVGTAYGKEQIMNGVTAATTHGTNYTDKITYKITLNGTQVSAIDTNVEGTYVISYNVKNEYGKAAVEVQRTVTVTVPAPSTEETTTTETPEETTTAAPAPTV